MEVRRRTSQEAPEDDDAGDRATASPSSQANDGERDGTQVEEGAAAREQGASAAQAKEAEAARGPEEEEGGGGRGTGMAEDIARGMKKKEAEPGPSTERQGAAGDDSQRQERGREGDQGGTEAHRGEGGSGEGEATTRDIAKSTHAAHPSTSVGGEGAGASGSGGAKRKAETRAEDVSGGGGSDSEKASSKKTRLVWTTELHARFMNAVNHLGVEHAVPKTILALMNVEGLTRENVASHLQKYRLYLKKKVGLPSSARLSSDSMPKVMPPPVGVPGMFPRPPPGGGFGGYGAGYPEALYVAAQGLLPPPHRLGTLPGVDTRQLGFSQLPYQHLAGGASGFSGWQVAPRPSAEIPQRDAEPGTGAPQRGDERLPHRMYNPSHSFGATTTTAAQQQQQQPPPSSADAPDTANPSTSQQQQQQNPSSSQQGHTLPWRPNFPFPPPPPW